MFSGLSKVSAIARCRLKPNPPDILLCSTSSQFQPFLCFLKMWRNCKKLRQTCCLLKLFPRVSLSMGPAKRFRNGYFCCKQPANLTFTCLLRICISCENVFGPEFASESETADLMIAQRHRLQFLDFLRHIFPIKCQPDLTSSSKLSADLFAKLLQISDGIKSWNSKLMRRYE